VPAPPSALWSRAVTHDDVRALLPHYAAGVLDDARAGAVRAHLVDGCLDCLHDVFARPVGAVPAAEPAPAPASPPAPRPRPLLVPAAVALVAVLASVAASVLGGRTTADRSTPPPYDAGTAAPGREPPPPATASAAAASRAATDEARAALGSIRRELESARLRIGSLKQAMRRQDADFRQKEQSMAAVVARLSAALPPADAARAPRDRPSTATASGTLAPCEESHVDLWSFDVKGGGPYTVTAEDADAATAADLCLVGSCRGVPTFAGDDEIPCRAAPGVGCPRATFSASADTACVVAVTVCSPGCGERGAAPYELRVDGAAALALIADDVSMLTGETADAGF
jgi:hypothetical protein